MLSQSIKHLPILILLIAFYSAAQANQSKPATDSQSPIVGVWRGNSTCMVKDSPCHDEVNVYRIAAVTGKPGWVTVVGGKIVNGKEIAMGSFDWKYDERKHTLTSPDGAFQFTLDADKLEGTLTVNNAVYRRIHLQRAEAAANQHESTRIKKLP
jgi:hypothetical protein